MSTISTMGLSPAALWPLFVLTLALLALSLALLALPREAGAVAVPSAGGDVALAVENVGDDATWSNTPPAIIAASQDEEGGWTWSETPPVVTTVVTSDGGANWHNSIPVKVVTGTALNDPGWNQRVPAQAVAG